MKWSYPVCSLLVLDSILTSTSFSSFVQTSDRLCDLVPGCTCSAQVWGKDADSQVSRAGFTSASLAWLWKNPWACYLQVDRSKRWLQQVATIFGKLQLVFLSTGEKLLWMSLTTWVVFVTVTFSILALCRQTLSSLPPASFCLHSDLSTHGAFFSLSESPSALIASSSGFSSLFPSPWP